MTSVPDKSKWTIRANPRDLEKRISEVAAQPDETPKGVTDKLHEVLDKKAKAARASESLRTEQGRRSMLIITDWLTYQLSDNSLYPREKTDAFDIVVIIDIDELRCIKCDLANGALVSS